MQKKSRRTLIASLGLVLAVFLGSVGIAPAASAAPYSPSYSSASTINWGYFCWSCLMKPDLTFDASSALTYYNYESGGNHYVAKRLGITNTGFVAADDFEVEISTSYSANLDWLYQSSATPGVSYTTNSANKRTINFSQPLAPGETAEFIVITHNSVHSYTHLFYDIDDSNDVAELNESNNYQGWFVSAP